MAVVHSPEELTHPALLHRLTIPAAPRLRDSCHACAASKGEVGTSSSVGSDQDTVSDE
jgi:hypothetical protein